MSSLQVCRDSEHNWLYHEIREYSQLQETKAAHHDTAVYPGLLEVEEELESRRLLEVDGELGSRKLLEEGEERSWTGELGASGRSDQLWAHL